MARKTRPGDVRVDVSRYRVDRLAEDFGGEEVENRDDEADQDDEADRDDEADAGQVSMDRRAQFVELTIQEAIRRGEFDDLPGAGRPLEGLDLVHDPDWWIRRKIERENLTGLGPPALTLRTENATLDTRLDALHTDAAVRELITDFNSRIVEARRQLQGGPPVVTPTRDVDAEVEAWRARSDERRHRDALAREEQERAFAALSPRDRREHRRQARRAIRRGAR